MLEAMMEPVYAKDHQRDLNETREPDHLTFDDLALKASPTPEVDDFSGPAKSSKNDVPAIIATPKVTPTQQLKQELLDASSTTDPIMRGIHLSRASLLLRELWQAGELSEENKGDIQDFQRALKVYGVGIEKVEGTYDSKTREAGQGLRVMMAQTYLKKRGLYPFEINGVLDEKTTAALKQYAQNRFLDPQEPDLLPGIIKRLAREHNR
jgi:peptidoglycan hydrolase-like protein with peptidoglycan-binding domain